MFVSINSVWCYFCYLIIPISCGIFWVPVQKIYRSPYKKSNSIDKQIQMSLAFLLIFFKQVYAAKVCYCIMSRYGKVTGEICHKEIGFISGSDSDFWPPALIVVMTLELEKDMSWITSHEWMWVKSSSLYWKIKSSLVFEWLEIAFFLGLEKLFFLTELVSNWSNYE